MKNGNGAIDPCANIVWWLCVFLGSGLGNDPRIPPLVRLLGKLMAQHRVGLVCGGGGSGLMRELVSSVLEHQGCVYAVTPSFLIDREGSNSNVTIQVVTEDMHERKKLMFEKADAFAALPGGIGTLEETLEQMTWAQLGRHKKPILLANLFGFWEPLKAMLAHMEAREYIRAGYEVRFLEATRVEDIIPATVEALDKVGIMPPAAEAEMLRLV